MKRRYPYQLKIYVPVEKEGCIKEFLMICKRENDSGAKKVLEWIEKYVDQHKNGNPQLLMPPFLEEPKQVLPKCKNLQKKGHLPNYRGWCKSLERWVTEEKCRVCG